MLLNILGVPVTIPPVYKANLQTASNTKPNASSSLTQSMSATLSSFPPNARQFVTKAASGKPLHLAIVTQ